jgi:hypothetical protein
MIANLSEEALSRVLAYLKLCGLPLTREVMLEALTLVRDALAEEEGGEQLLVRVMEQIPRRYRLPEPDVAPVCPPLRRGSIHYAP